MHIVVNTCTHLHLIIVWIDHFQLLTFVYRHVITNQCTLNKIHSSPDCLRVRCLYLLLEHSDFFTQEFSMWSWERVFYFLTSEEAIWIYSWISKEKNHHWPVDCFTLHNVSNDVNWCGTYCQATRKSKQ